MLNFQSDGFERGGFVHVIANEEMFRRSNPGIEVFDGSFKVEKAIGTDDQSLFPRNRQGGFTCRPSQHRLRSGCAQSSTGCSLQEVSSGNHGTCTPEDTNTLGM